MTTNRQLRDWLKGFPDDCLINVVTTEDASRGYQMDVSVYSEIVELPDVEMTDLKSWSEFDHVHFDVKYDYDKEVCIGVRSITLGKNFRD